MEKSTLAKKNYLLLLYCRPKREMLFENKESEEKKIFFVRFLCLLFPFNKNNSQH